MRRAASMTTSMGADLLVVLQPALVDRAHRTPVEDALLTVSLVPHASAEALSRSYDQMRAGLTELAETGALHFLDASRIFDDERATSTDMWHFTDFGHAILGRAIAAQVAPLLQRRRPPG